MSTQISLSFELICLVNWLIKNEKAMLNSLIKHAIQHGFIDDLQQKEAADHSENNAQLHDTLVDFLEYLEQALIKNLETVHLDHKTKNDILPALQKIETDSLDFKTMWLSMQQAKARINKTQEHGARTQQKRDPLSNVQQSPGQSSTEILFEQILKNWKPNNKENIN